MAPVILVIDDDVHFIKYISVLLEYEGYRVCKAFDGEEGIKNYIQQQPHLIITDIVMPKKEGIELIKMVRKQDSKIPIIAMSGGNHGFGNDYLRMVKMLGANAILRKPFGPEEFLAIVNEFMAPLELSFSGTRYRAVGSATN